ncbi:DUF4239 domain-containing protein [Mycobacterium ulcerans]|uniref:DUF4239 domain-containing protein n=2 Tax=Mycobacterium ulcerans TaxID=1809 RepID=A0ABY3VDD0_MYCUL|nr:DUF4239 domain-containing protein [Mycobacterium ulcerans]ABL06605.1 conserved hypothetical membrane protein [Mycobacterium ulcerans Agy99]MEB3903592.1 DUF4239 domain-containing protein [Mycobacterium ulcerans]MEB3907732.1 DUF4239 domain-containing protein [Mycobacterium ulcerans]MEB3917926.1 DUF4239 domain-containing protein [Mycobacterium ulcerans]MEB3922125.1 DUF4239 domain-containing protein [Mycobacterium ulcerans]
MINIPAWLLLVALVILVAGGAVLIQMIVRRRFPKLIQDAHNDATRFAYGVIGFVYAFFVGFMVSALWSQINNEDSQARSEGAAAIQLARDLTVFDTADRDRIRLALLQYERAAVAEWHIAASGSDYPQVQPRDDTQKIFLAASFRNLEKMYQARVERVIQARTDEGPSWLLWSVILLTSGLVLGCSIVFGVEQPRIHYTLVATVGVLVAVNLFLLLELGHPFTGALATSPEPLRDVIHVLWPPSS